MPFAERLGALRERDFRLLFAGTTITTIGDRLAGIALAFAVLDIASATALGLVFAVRQGVQALVVVAGGVLSDRIPRNLVLVGASLVQGAAQAATAACVLGDIGGVAAIVALQAVYGLGLGLVLPAEVGLVPQTVSRARLQQANALQGLSRNMIGVLGPAIGGAVVVASSPGVALAFDAVSFLVCAGLLRRIRVTARDATTSPGFVHELREGWQEFTSRTWLWASVVLFGIGNVAFAGWIVLGPAVADERLGGAGHAQSRVASYDTLGSMVILPIGMALVGPLADAIGLVETLWIGLVVMWASWAMILLLPSVWAIRRPTAAVAPSPA